MHSYDVNVNSDTTFHFCFKSPTFVLYLMLILKFLAQLQSLKFSGSFLWLHLSETLELTSRLEM